jgi:hypothetical protein
MKQTTITQRIFSRSGSPVTSDSLQSQEKVQQNKSLILYSKSRSMKTILTVILALFIQVIAFSQVSSFTGKLNNSNNRIDLKWATTSEKNVSHFVIEKSTDGKNYSQVGIVFAYGNTSETMNYPFIDKNINAGQAGTIYYRLRSVDNDGKNKLSEVATITIATKNEQTIAILNSFNQAGNEIGM